MPGGRPRKPIAAKLLAGSYREDRDGPIDSQVKAGGTPEPPGDLQGEALAYWHRIVPGLVASGVAAACDAESLGLMCWWLAQLRATRKDIDEARGGAEQKKSLPQLMVMAGICTDKFNQLAARFGLNPSDRAKLRVEATGPAQTPVPPRKR